MTKEINWKAVSVEMAKTIQDLITENENLKKKLRLSGQVGDLGDAARGDSHPAP